MESSCTICVCTTRKPSFFRTSTTAGPERSTRSPREQESLTVTTAAVRSCGVGRSAVEEDIFFLFLAASASAGWAAGSAWSRARRSFFDGFRAAIALRFVEQAQALHLQTLGVEV